MTVKEYLSHVPNDEIMKRLITLDRSLYELHQHGLYVVCNIVDIDVINDEIHLASFKDKVDYLNSGYNKNGDKQDILELCSIGVCAFNHFDKYYSSKEFISNLIDNFDKFVDNGKVPRIMHDYYVEVFVRGNIISLNDFILNHQDEYKNSLGGNGNSNSKVKVKATPVGMALARSEENRNAAYVKVLLLPSIIALLYLVVLVTYFIFYK